MLSSEVNKALRSDCCVCVLGAIRLLSFPAAVWRPEMPVTQSGITLKKVILSPALQEFGNLGNLFPTLLVPGDGAWTTHCRVWMAMTSNLPLLTWVCFHQCARMLYCLSTMPGGCPVPFSTTTTPTPTTRPPFFPPHKDKTKLLVLPSDFRVLDCGMRYFYSLLLVLRTIWYIVRQMINTSHSSSICESWTLATAP